MSKKDFSKASTSRVYAAIEEATADTNNMVYKPEQADPEAKQLKVQITESAPEPKQLKVQVANVEREPQVIHIAPKTDEKPKKRYKDRKEYTPEEAAAFLESFQSAGRKGIKLPRINLAFTPENYLYIRRMARARGESYTDFVNWCLKEHRDQNHELYEQVQKFLEEM